MSAACLLALPLLALAVLLSAPRALSLRCHLCLEVEDAVSDCRVAPCWASGVCFQSNLTYLLATGERTRSVYKGCAASCRAAGDALQKVVDMSAAPGLGGQAVRIEAQGPTCCRRDLCNRGAGLAVSRALAAGVLLRLGPRLLRALL